MPKPGAAPAPVRRKRLAVRFAPGRRGIALLVRVQAADRVHHPLAVLLPLLLFALEGLEKARLDDDAAHLRGDRAQQAQLVRREPPAPQRLHDQDAERCALLGDRHAEERVVALLAGLGEVLVARVRQRIDDHHRLVLLDDHAGEAFVDAHRHLADGGALETGGRPQRQPLILGIEEVERADLGAHLLGDDLDDVLERLLEILRMTGERTDVLEQREPVALAPAVTRHRLARGGFSVAHHVHDRGRIAACSDDVRAEGGVPRNPDDRTMRRPHCCTSSRKSGGAS